jgi:coenzyme F420-reducing hydrogenase alpha subunit
LYSCGKIDCGDLNQFNWGAIVIIAVRENNDTKYVQVDELDEEKARKVGFRFIHKRKEIDYNELAHNARAVEVQNCSQDVANILLELR